MIKRFVDGQGRPGLVMGPWGLAEGTSPVDRYRELLNQMIACFPLFGVIRTDALRRSGLIRGYYGSDRALLAELVLQGPFHQVRERLYTNRFHRRASRLLSRQRPAALDRRRGRGLASDAAPELGSAAGAHAGGPGAAGDRRMRGRGAPPPRAAPCRPDGASRRLAERQRPRRRRQRPLMRQRLLEPLAGSGEVRASGLSGIKRSWVYTNPVTQWVLANSPTATHLLENLYSLVLNRVQVREAARDAADGIARLATLQARFPEALGSRCDDAPIIVLSAGWRSGSTLVQRVLMSSEAVMIWGEPFARSGLVPRLLDQLRAFTPEWPSQSYLLENFSGRLTDQWIANIYPGVGRPDRGAARLSPGIARRAGPQARPRPLGVQGGAAGRQPCALPQAAVPQSQNRVPGAQPL